MPIVINFQEPEKVTVLVQDVSDDVVVTRMVRDVRRVFRHLVGGWKVTLCANERGTWRLELSGVSGRHVWIFAASPEALPAVVVEKLEAFVRDSTAAWRPLPA